MSSQAWMIVPDNVALSVLILAVLAMVFLYAARMPMHALIRSLGQALGGAAAHRLRAGCSRPRPRCSSATSAVLLAQGRQEVGQRVEREFERLGALVAARPAGLSRRCSASCSTRSRASRRTTRSAAKCRRRRPTGSRRSPPSPSVKSQRQRAGAEACSRRSSARSTRSTTRRSPSTARSYERRHKILEGFLPFWRSVDKNLVQVEQNMAGLQASARTVDAHMESYEQINEGTDKAAARAHRVGLHPVRHLAAGDGGGRRRRLHQLQADRAADVRDGRRRRLHHRVAAHLRGGGAGDHLRRGVDGPVPAGGAAHHAPLPAHRQPERPHAPAHDVDRAHAAGHAGRASRRRSR